jgi:endo-1,4-beta-D-glucanase Y
MKSSFLILLSLFCITSGYSQNYPFPQNSIYKYGIYPLNRNHTDADSVYTNWKASHVTAQGAGGYRRVLWDTLRATVSEGIGYGMLISVNMNDKTLFDDLWGYYNLHSDPNGLMIWLIDSLGIPLLGQNGSATDAEEDVAYALILADRQWGSSGSVNYLQAGINVINKIYQYEIDTVFNLPKSGDEPGSIYRVNASYFAPAYYRAFKYYSGNSGWDSVITGCYNFLFFINNDTTGLVPDWCLPNGNPMPPCPPPYSCRYTYYYDANRTPWRISMDYLWYGNPLSNNFCSLISTFARNIGSSFIKDEYALNGTPLGILHNNAFLGPFGAGAMATNFSFQNFCDSIYKENVNTYSTGWNYYNSSLKLLTLLIQTGNFIPLYPKIPVLISPINNSVNNPPNVLLDWQNLTHTDFYRVQISLDSTFNNFILDSNHIPADSLKIASGLLIQGTKYYWRVKAYNYFGDGKYSEIRNFRISVTGIVNTGNDIPNNFMLYNCYPNPFNSTATIKFDIPENTQAEFSLFDVSGKKLTDIANSMYKAGQYKIIFDLSGFSSGIYFCRFKSMRYTNVIKLLLIK